MVTRHNLLDAPPLISRLLGSRLFALLARVALTTAYWWGGVAKLFDFPGAIAEMQHFGLRPPGALAALTILTELGASVLLIAGRGVWLAAGVLAVFTAWATLLAHAFWTFPPAQRAPELNSFLEHIGLVGGFLLAAILGEQTNSRSSESTARLL
jgi:transmembrane protein